MAISIDGTNGLTTDNAALKLDGTTLVVDDTNNRVGIGTSSPASKLDVDGKISLSSGTYRAINYRSGNNDILYEFDSGDFYRQDIGTSSHQFFTGNTERMRIDANGYVTTPYRPAFNVSSSVSMSSTTWTYNSTHLNVGGHMNISNGRFTAPVAGVYVFFFGTIGTTTHGDQDIYLWVNGSSQRWGNARPDDTGGWASFNPGTGIVSLSAGDYVQAISTQSNSYSDSNQWLHFRGFLLG